MLSVMTKTLKLYHLSVQTRYAKFSFPMLRLYMYTVTTYKLLNSVNFLFFLLDYLKAGMHIYARASAKGKRVQVQSRVR